MLVVVEDPPPDGEVVDESELPDPPEFWFEFGGVDVAVGVLVATGEDDVAVLGVVVEDPPVGVLVATF